MNRIFVAMLLQVSSLLVHSQMPELYFKNIGIENGLSNNRVKCILQDTRGFIWIGTEDGLNRFDGTNFLIFRHLPSNPSGISGNIISDLLEDKDGVLWIATEDGGLNRYDYRLPPKDQFRQFKHLPHDTSSIPVNVINAMLEDAAGNIWLATSGASLIRFNKKTQKFDRKLKVGRTFYDLCLDKNGTIWAGRQGGSILKVDPVTTSYEVQKAYEDFYMKLPHVVVTSLFMDSDNDMWYGSWDKALYRFNSRNNSEETFSFPNEEVISFNEDFHQRLWIGGKYNGLYLYDKKENRFYNFKHDPVKDGSLANNTVNCIFIDKTGNSWLGTDAGISIYNPLQQQFTQTFLSHADGNTNHKTIVYDFFEDAGGTIWVGTNEGIYQKNASMDLVHIPVSYNKSLLHVTKFFEDENGELYLGTNYSFFRFNKLSNRVIPLPNMEKDKVMSRLIESRIVSVVKDTINHNPSLIVSPYGHFIAYYDLVNNYWVSRQDSTQAIQHKYNIRDNLVRKMLRTKSGTIWLANLREGLGEWKALAGEPIRYYTNDPQSSETISNNNVFDVLEDGGNLWVSTYGGGLNYFDTSTKRFSHIPPANNLIEGIQADAHENIWMISNGNIQSYNKKTQSYASFELPDIEKSGGVKGYIYKTKSGQMYVAGENYFITFNPDSLKALNQPSSAIFTDFKIFNNSYSDLLFNDSLVLQYDQNFFSLEFSAPDFSTGKSVQYIYKLEGVDKDWVKAGTRNFASYSNINSGLYHFKVQAVDNSGKPGNAFTSINIRIIPPFWERWWFYVICTVTLVLIIYIIYWYRFSELVKRQAMRNKIAQDLHDNVGSTLSSISIYSQVAKIQNEQHNKVELSDILGKIGVTSNEMISEMNDIVWAINPRNDDMEKIFQRMESFARPLLAAKNMRFEFNIDPDLLQLNLDMSKRKNFYLVFKEAVNNAVKYSSCKHLVVEIYTLRNNIELVVKDDGIGFDRPALNDHVKNSMSGNGIRNMQLRASEIAGEYLITTEPGKGTTIFLSFPVT